MLVNVLEVTN